MKKFLKVLASLLLVSSLSSCSVIQEIIDNIKNNGSNNGSETGSGNGNGTGSGTGTGTGSDSGSGSGSSSGSGTGTGTGTGSGSTTKFEGGTYCIISINDLHGAIEKTDSNAGMAAVATEIENARNTYGKDKVIVLNAGDAFQGQFVSNITFGRSVIDTMNEVGFDGMTLGNHEFDWGLDTILDYWDKDQSNGEATFPIGCANLYYKSTNAQVDFLPDSYTFMKDGLKIGVIPTIGYGEETSILGTRVADYKFANPVPIVKEISKRLRSEGCDFIIVNSHDGGYDNSHDDVAYNLNENVAKFPAESRVDAIINAHVHSREKFEYTQASGGAKLVSVQAGCNSNYYGKIVFNIDSNKKVSTITNNYVRTGSVEKASVKQVVDNYVAQSNLLAKEKLATVGESITYKGQLYTWAGEVIQKSTGCDIAITNEGGIRNVGTDGSFAKNSSITVEDLYAIMPFDNAIMTCQVSGSKIKQWLEKYPTGNIYCYKSGLSLDNISTSKTYNIAIIDYLAEKDYNVSTFQNSTYKASGLVFRDLLEEDIKLQQSMYSKWTPSNGAVISNKL